MRLRTCGILAAIICLGAGVISSSLYGAAQTDVVPRFELDGSWPKPLPNGWEFGYVMAVAVDQRDHVFVLHTTQDDYGQPIIKDKDRPNDSLKLSGWYERK